MKMRSEKGCKAYTGTAWIRLLPEQVMDVPERLVEACKTLGAVSVDSGDIQEMATSAPPKELSSVDRMQGLVKAMQHVLESGDESLMTKGSRQPRQAVLESMVDFSFSAAERDAAWEMVKNGESA